MRRPISDQERELLKSLNGIFSDTKSSKILSNIYMIFFATIIPGFSLFVVFLESESHNTMLKVIYVLLFWFCGFFVAFSLYTGANQSYEFNGSNIKMMNRFGKVVKQISIDNIVSINVRIEHRAKIVRWDLINSKDTLILVFFDSIVKKIDSMKKF